MHAAVHRPSPGSEYLTPEGCWILESWNTAVDPDVSMARARVAPGVTTQLHRLHGVAERYLIASGTGTVRIGDLPPRSVQPGDVVVIPPEVTQQITNDGNVDLVFHCVCTPRFTPLCYEAL